MGKALLRPLGAIIIALLLGGILLQLSGHAAGDAYRALAAGAFGDRDAWARTLAQTMPLLLTGSAVGIALAAGLFNIGAEGQLAVGALSAAWVGSQLPASLALPVALLTSALVGGAWAWLPVWLKQRRGAHEVITAILLNYVARNVTRYLATSPLKDPSDQAPQTREVSQSLARLFPGSELHTGLLVALLLAVLVALALTQTLWGYETRVTGAAPQAARTGGIDTERVARRAFLLSGALAGLAGAVVVLGAIPFRRFPADFYGIGYGFDGLTVALLAGSAPWAVLPAALALGALGAGADQMSFATETPRQLAQIVQALLLLGLTAQLVWKKRAPAAGDGSGRLD